MGIRPSEAIELAGRAFEAITEEGPDWDAMDPAELALAHWFNGSGESPIEAAILYEIVKNWGAPNPRASFDTDAVRSLGFEPCAGIFSRQPWHVFEQCKVGKFTADFAFVSPVGQVIVECDGHGFHERTKEQVARDKRRDRFFVSNGWSVLRFSGSEIYKDSTGCAMEVLSLLRKMEKGIR